MPQAARTGDPVITGHLCTPITAMAVPILNWNVTAEKQLLVQEFDFTIPHLIEVSVNPLVCVIHTAPLWVGFPTVLCWFLPQGYVGSPTDLGIVSKGAITVWVGGKPSGGQAPAMGERNSLGQQVGGGARQGFAP